MGFWDELLGKIKDTSASAGDNLFGSDETGLGLLSPEVLSQAVRNAPNEAGQSIRQLGQASTPGLIGQAIQNSAGNKGPAEFIAKNVGEFRAGLEGVPEEEKQQYVKQFTNKAIDKMFNDSKDTDKTADVPTTGQTAKGPSVLPTSTETKVESDVPLAGKKPMPGWIKSMISKGIALSPTLPLALSGNMAGASGFAKGTASGIEAAEKLGAKATARKEKEEKESALTKRYAGIEARKRVKDMLDLNPDKKFEMSENPKLYDTLYNEELKKVMAEWGEVYEEAMGRGRNKKDLPDDLPSPKGVKEGSVLKDGGKIIAIMENGEWVTQ